MIRTEVNKVWRPERNLGVERQKSLKITVTLRFNEFSEKKYIKLLNKRKKIVFVSSKSDDHNFTID